MSKAKNKNGYGKGTFIDSQMFLSPAYISLGMKGTSLTVSSCSHAVLMMFLGKRKFGYFKNKKNEKVHQRSDDNEFTLTYKELSSRGISQQRATRAFDELLAKGFISIKNLGGLFNKDKATYALEDDFIRWRPGDSSIRERKRDVRRGYQGKKIGAVSKYKTKVAHVNVGHPHTRQQGTPYE